MSNVTGEGPRSVTLGLKGATASGFIVTDETFVEQNPLGDSSLVSRSLCGRGQTWRGVPCTLKRYMQVYSS